MTHIVRDRTTDTDNRPSTWDFIDRSQAAQTSQTRKYIVRDEEAAGSNPATPTRSQDLQPTTDRLATGAQCQSEAVHHGLAAFGYDRKTEASLLSRAADLDRILSERYPGERLANDFHERYLHACAALQRRATCIGTCSRPASSTP